MKLEAQSDIVLNRMEGVLMASINVALTSTVLAGFREDVFHRLTVERSPVLVLDLSGASLMDVEEFESLRMLAQSVAIMGTETWFVGLRPEVAATLVTLGARTGGLRTALDLDTVLKRVRHQKQGAGHA